MELVTISYDSPKNLADFTGQHGISFTMLSDVGSATIKRYGILNTVSEEALGPNGDDPAVLADFPLYVSVTSPSERFVGIAYPGTFILDPEGVVTARFFEDFYQERDTAASILVKLDAGGSSVEGTEISTSHIKIKTYPSDSVIARGERFSLAVEITPQPNIHVYARVPIAIVLSPFKSSRNASFASSPYSILPPRSITSNRWMSACLFIRNRSPCCRKW